MFGKVIAGTVVAGALAFSTAGIAGATSSSTPSSSSTPTTSSASTPSTPKKAAVPCTFLQQVKPDLQAFAAALDTAATQAQNVATQAKAAGYTKLAGNITKRVKSVQHQEKQISKRLNKVGVALRLDQRLTHRPTADLPTDHRFHAPRTRRESTGPQPPSASWTGRAPDRDAVEPRRDGFATCAKMVKRGRCSQRCRERRGGSRFIRRQHARERSPRRTQWFAGSSPELRSPGPDARDGGRRGCRRHRPDHGPDHRPTTPRARHRRAARRRRPPRARTWPRC